MLGIATPNHIKLLRDCYPTKTLLTTPLAELKPDSNFLSKLTYYCAGRQKKIPKVAAAILERAEREARTSGAKGRALLAVTLEVMRSLVGECRTSAELGCFAEHALHVAELGFTRKEAGQRDPELEARAAGLFHAVATFASGPFLALDSAVMKRYQQCLAAFSSMAISDRPQSRLIGLQALDAAASSELLFANAADYPAQAREIIAGLLFNCFSVSSSELLEISVAPTVLGALESRKAPSILVATDSIDANRLAKQALKSFSSLFYSSSSAQLSRSLAIAVEWLDRVPGGKGWQNDHWIEWFGSSTVKWSNPQSAAGVVSWWSEQLMEIGDAAPANGKPAQLVRLLSGIFKGPDPTVGISVGTILGHLTSTLIRRAPLGAGDTLSASILETIADLASKIYYFDQSSDIVGDLIDGVKKVRRGGEEGRDLGIDDQIWASREFVRAIKNVLEETKKAVPVEQMTSMDENGQRPPLLEQETIKGNGVHAGSSNSSKRHRIRPSTIQESLFLLTEVDTTLRREYQRLLLAYVSEELEINSLSPVIVASKGSIPVLVAPVSDTATVKFLTELNTSIYELATCPSLGLLPFSSSALSRSPSSRSTRSSRNQVALARRSSKSSRKSTGVEHALSNASDYNYLRDIIVAVQARGSASAVLATVPMLLTLEKECAVEWSEKTGDGEAGERVQACREIVARGLTTIGEVWDVAGVERVGREALARLTPSVLTVKPSSTFAAKVRDWTTGSELDNSAIIESLASSHSLQSAAGLDQGGLRAVLSMRWSADDIRSQATPAMIYRAAGSKSVTSVLNQSRARLSSAIYGKNTISSTSLADLQLSAGQASGTTSRGTPSIASTNGASTMASENRRRSGKLAVKDVLEGLGGLGRAKRGSSSRLSNVE